MDTTSSKSTETKGTLSADGETSTSIIASNMTHTAADKLHKAAAVIRDRTSGSSDSRVTRFAGSTADVIENAAAYVDNASLTALRDDLGGVVRRYPFQSLAVSLGVGFIAARMIRR